MILKLRIDSQDLKRFVPETDPVLKPDALEDIVPVDVVIPLDAVQMRSHADQCRREAVPITSDPPGSRGQRVVMPPTTLPKNMIAALHPSR